MIKQYRLIDNISNEMVMIGPSRLISAFTGASKSHISESAREHKTICAGRYRVVDISSTDENNEDYKPDTGLSIAARHWDEFCETLRKQYGIPVYSPGKGEKR